MDLWVTGNLDQNLGTWDLDATGAIDVSAVGAVSIASTGGTTSVTGADNLLLTAQGLTGVLLTSTHASSTLTINAANDYEEIIAGTHKVDTNTTVDDVSGSGVAHGHITDLDALATNSANIDAIWFYS
jgi:hypothetical protein